MIPVGVSGLLEAQEWMLTGVGQLTPFVTKRMAPTKGKYTKDQERNGSIVAMQRAFDGKEYLDMWASDNGPEVLEQERLEHEPVTSETTATRQ